LSIFLPQPLLSRSLDLETNMSSNGASVPDTTTEMTDVDKGKGKGPALEHPEMTMEEDEDDDEDTGEEDEVCAKLFSL
jgi:hypothetical protein